MARDATPDNEPESVVVTYRFEARAVAALLLACVAGVALFFTVPMSIYMLDHKGTFAWRWFMSTAYLGFVTSICLALSLRDLLGRWPLVFALVVGATVFGLTAILPSLGLWFNQPMEKLYFYYPQVAALALIYPIYLALGRNRWFIDQNSQAE